MRWLMAVLIFVLVACSAEPVSTPAERVNLGISNGTAIAVTLSVNGQRIGEFAAQSGEPTIDVSRLPPLPWNVEARSPSGRLLTSMNVAPGQVQSTTGPGGVIEHSGALGRVDLSCGRLTIWAADVQPSGPAPPPSPGTPGDCAP